MSHPQPKRPSSVELIDAHSKAQYVSWEGKFKPNNSDARSQVKRYK